MQPAAAPGQATNAQQDTAAEIARLEDQLLRLRADFDNFRKRTVRDREDYCRRANEKLLKELLPVVDHFELGLQHARKYHVKHAVVDGLAKVLEELRAVLFRAGVEPIETEGQMFDPRWHECVAHTHSAHHPENAIIAQRRAGYRLGHYVLRPAQVVVSKGPPDGSAEGLEPQAKAPIPAGPETTQ